MANTRAVMAARARLKRAQERRRATEGLNPEVVKQFRSKGWSNLKDYGDHVSGFALIDGITYVLSAWTDLEQDIKRIEMFTHAGGRVRSLGVIKRLVNPRDLVKMAKRLGYVEAVQEKVTGKYDLSDVARDMRRRGWGSIQVFDRHGKVIGVSTGRTASNGFSFGGRTCTFNARTGMYTVQNENGHTVGKPGKVCPRA